MDGHVDLGLEAADELLGVVGREERRHVLDADGAGAHVDQLAGHVHIVVQRVYRGDGVDHGALEVLAGLLDRRGGGLEVADVVERVEDAKDVHAVLGRLVDEAAHDVVTVVAVADDVLAAQEHLQRRAHDVLLDEPQALPRVFVEKAQLGVERGASPALERVEAHLVHDLEDGQHVGGTHARGPERLVAVAQGRVGDAYSASSHGCLLAPGRAQARPRYSRVRVSTLMRSPSSMKRGTCTTTPVSRVSGFVAPWAVSPRTPGSDVVMRSSTKLGACTSNGSALR